LFILEEPYISEFLALTVAESSRPVLATPFASRRLNGTTASLLQSPAFAEQARQPGARIYSNSENAIAWVAENLTDTALPRMITVLKDKIAFRELLRPSFPDYPFAEVCVADLDPAVLPLPVPFVIKPAVGFFSLGVHVVERAEAWPDTVAAIREDVERAARFYPPEVLGLERYVAEGIISGEEFAVDAYFSATGEPVLVNIMGHLFASDTDVSDRVYYSSPALIEQWREPFERFLGELGRLADLRDFPVHAELRVDEHGRIAPIEVNPMRFGGWCAADMTHHAWGENPYRLYLEDRRPDWDRILSEREGRAVGLVIADFPGSVDRGAIESVDYDRFLSRFSRPLELRPIDFRRYPVFAFLFTEVAENDMGELREVLGEDLTGYLSMRE
jgi:hypothetical protein